MYRIVYSNTSYMITCIIMIRIMMHLQLVNICLPFRNDVCRRGRTAMRRTFDFQSSCLKFS